MTFECIFRVERLSKHNVGGQLDGYVILCGCDESVLAQRNNKVKTFSKLSEGVSLQTACS